MPAWLDSPFSLYLAGVFILTIRIIWWPRWLAGSCVAVAVIRFMGKEVPLATFRQYLAFEEVVALEDDS